MTEIRQQYLLFEASLLKYNDELNIRFYEIIIDWFNFNCSEILILLIVRLNAELIDWIYIC